MATPYYINTVSQRWGADKVAHYGWLDKSLTFWTKLGGAALAVEDWSEAVVKLNRLILRRASQARRRPVVVSVNSIEADDLINLRAWTGQGSYVKKKDSEEVRLPFCPLQAIELPAGFSLDRFGLLIRTDQGLVTVADEPMTGLHVAPQSQPTLEMASGRRDEDPAAGIRGASAGDPAVGEPTLSEFHAEALPTGEARGEGLYREPPVVSKIVVTRVGFGPVGLSLVQMVGQIWGAEKVDHYRWAEKAENFRVKLYSAARTVQDWDEAAVKLSRLILRRLVQVGRRELSVSVNPITTDDLINLKSWIGADSYTRKNDRQRKVLPFRRLDDTELPPGCGFDAYGLLVRMEEQALPADNIGFRTTQGVLGQRKRHRTSDNDQVQTKRTKTAKTAEFTLEDQAVGGLRSVLSWLDDEFAEKEWLSQEQRWCTAIPLDRKVSTVQSFYKAFHDLRTLPIATCMVCYRKYGRGELEDISCEWWVASFGSTLPCSPFQCRRCFPLGQSVPSCSDCVSHLRRGVLAPAAQIHTRLGCEHVYPNELKGLTPIEEKLIALNSCYGFITKYSLPGGQGQTVRYPKHVKGHITVFPNNVQELVTNVLPHPLVRVMEEIHVSWQGREKPVPKDLSSLLSVRRRVVEKALVWLKRNNPLYAGIQINKVEMDSWGNSAHGVPPQIYNRLERNEPSGREKARTGQLVPAAERGMEEDGPVDIQEIIAELCEDNRDRLCVVREEKAEGFLVAEAADVGLETIHDISASGMFPLDAPLDIRDEETLQTVCESLGQGVDAGARNRSPGWAVVKHVHTQEPYIAVSRGADFANSLEPQFLAKTFPTLFPFGSGGPRQAEEGIVEAMEGGAAGQEQEITARRLVSSRNMSLETWARAVLRRHGGRFAVHHIFAFLVFNIGVRSRNRRVSMLSVSRAEFPRVERIVQSLTRERLEKAKAELELSNKTKDDGVNQVLKSLSLYGFRQPMSRENRMSMRRKIKSLIIRYGIPAIWFTLNPNDITNPVKLRLAAYRIREADEAEAFLTSLDQAYKRTKLAVSDPLSSALFFHREMSLFFEHFVKAGEDSVFGRISQYFGAVETNERGALHLHGLLWLQGNVHLSTILEDVQKEGRETYRDQIIQYVDSVFTEDLDQEAAVIAQTERSVTSDISSLLRKREQFVAAFDDEANFCAGSSQIHTHSPTCVKYSIGRRHGRQDLCRFKAPWRLVEKTGFTPDGVLQVRRSHSLVNRWNKAMAVGLRHNHDISFVATLCKTMALIYYVTNYATKVEDPESKRAAAAAEVIGALGQPASEDGENTQRGSGAQNGHQSKARQFLMRVANRVFTERALSQVEVVSYLLGYPTEFARVEAWAFVNVSSLYWQVFRHWPHLRQSASGTESMDGCGDDTVLLKEAGQRLSLVQSYPHRGTTLGSLCLYDYMSTVKLKRKAKEAMGWGEIQLDSAWPPSQTWVQSLRKPGKHAVVCLDGYLSMDFAEEEEQSCHRRAAVQHLALFVPWQAFLQQNAGDINFVWERQKQLLSGRVLHLVNNIQLLRRSAEDARRDAKQWAASSGELESSVEAGGVEGEGEQDSRALYRADAIGTTLRLIDVLRSTVGSGQVTAGSKEIFSMVQELCQFHAAASDAAEGPAAAIAAEGETCLPDLLESPVPLGYILPGQELVNSIRSQQKSASREKERMIQGIQSGPDGHTVSEGGGHDREGDEGPATSVQFGPSTSFLTAGRELAVSFKLNHRQSIAFRLICRQLDRVRRDERGTAQLCQFIGGEGGTGKSRIIEAIAALFAGKGMSSRLLITATSGTAAARVDGITIHSACGFSKDSSSRRPRNTAVDGLRPSEASDLFIDGQRRMGWQEKWLLIVDEVSMLGARTLYAVDEQLRKLRGCREDFGGVPIVLFSGDFHQFRPVQERSIVLPSAAVAWDIERAFSAEQRHQHDRAHSLWKKFTTVVMLDEQVRIAEDPQLQRLLTRIRSGVQDRTDVDFLNSRCYREGRRIPWERGITVVTPLNRNRWNLNIEGSLSFQKQQRATMRIFISEHRWKEGHPAEEEALMMAGLGDDSSIPVPPFFMFVPGMPVVVNQNTHQGLKLVNGASYTAIDVIPDKAYPGHRINADTILYFGPPAAIVLQSNTTRDFRFVGMPAGTILLTPISTKIPCQRKRPWQGHDVSRRGLPCSAAFACTDYKVQGRTLGTVALELRGTRTVEVRGQAVPSQCDPYSLYVQLSRCPSLDGMMLLSEARERDFVGNVVPEDMVEAERRLRELSDSTISEAASWDWSKGA